MKTTQSTRIDPTAAELACMKPGQRKVISSFGGVSVVLERSTHARTGRIVRESAKGFEVVRSIKF